VRSETSPEDVPGMARSAGVLTARGGLASHAAVVARGWGIPAVVGAEAIHPGADKVEIDGRVLRAGERITIDGGTGGIHLGEVPGSWQVAPEAARLLGWARELGIAIGASRDDAAASETGEAAAHEDAPSDPRDAIEQRDIMRPLLVTGGASLEHLADVTLAEPDALRPLVERLVEERLAERTSDRIRLSAAGKLEASAVFAADREAVGEQRSVGILDSFHTFDARVKDLVTAWQVRDVAGEQVLNDHSDEAYDARVIDDLVALHRDLVAWLSPLGAGMRPYAVYRSRLDRAIERVRAGDGEFVASPRVDSYHSVWFELHEDLIRLAGRRRADEAAAGRA
jgi:pyruvate, orthophosphate dikinase